MADANAQSNPTPANADDQAAKDAAAKAAADKEAADKAEADKKAQAEADKQAAADKKAADKKAAQDKKLAEAANAPQAPAAPATPAAPADGDEPAETTTPAAKPARVVNDPTQNNRGRNSDIQVLIDAMPDEIYDAFVAPHNLDSRGVDEESGFDLRKITNPTLDGLRLRLREQGYNV